MQINITGHHVELTPALRDYVNHKMQKIQKHFSNITNVHVILSVDNRHFNQKQKWPQKAEACVNLARGTITAESASEDMYAAIDVMMDKLDRQVIKHKEKLKDRGNSDEIV